MSRRELYRVYELIGQIQANSPLMTHFQDFDKSLNDEPSKKDAFFRLEEELHKLDAASWDNLKKEVAPLPQWRQLMDRINEVKGYVYIASVGCKEIKFIPRDRKRTPDWQGMLEGRKVLCEVKTINTSDDEMEFRKGGTVRRLDADTDTSWSLSSRVLKKFEGKISDAESQLQGFDNSAETRRIAFIVVNFDNLLGGHPESYFKQIEGFLRQNPVPGIRVVCYGKTVLGEGHLTFDWHESAQCEPILRMKTP